MALMATLVTVRPASADVSWTDWTSAVPSGGPGAISGVMGVINVTYAGDYLSLVTNYPSWTPAGSYTDGVLVPNAPPPADNIIQLVGGNPDVNTVSFSAPVTNPVMAIWSLGSGGNPAVFVFQNAAPTIVAGGPSAEYHGASITPIFNGVAGAEGNGTVEFVGTFNSISWTNPESEYWYGFTVGMGGGTPAVPEPSSLLLLGIFAGAVSLGARRFGWNAGRR